MSKITKDSTLLEVAAIVSDALQKANIAATLSGGGAVSIYTENEYQSKDLDFVTAAMVDDLKPVLIKLGYEHTGIPRLSQFEHPCIEWYVEFPPAPLTFGHLYATQEDCAVIDSPVGQLHIITPTQSVMDRLAAAFTWNDAQSRDQAVLVAANQTIDWNTLKTWFLNEGESDDEFERFQAAVRAVKESNS